MVVSVGVNLSHHPQTRQPTADGGAAIAIDGRLAFASAEERISRDKYDGGYQRSLAAGLASLGLSTSDVDVVGVVGFGTSSTEDLPDWQLHELRSAIGPRAEVRYCSSHHEGHVWSAIGQLSVTDALIVVIDHTGSTIEAARSGALDSARCEQTSYYSWRDGVLELIARDHDGFGDVGYGRFYSKVTRYVGFGSYQDAGKLMGLAPFATKARLRDLPSAYAAGPHGEVTTITNDRHSDDGLADLAHWLRSRGAPEEYWTSWPAGEITAAGAELAAWAQRSLEESVLRRVTPLVEAYRPAAIVMCGGVALNSVLNGVLSRALEPTVLIPNSPGDAGLSVGALHHAERQSGRAGLSGFSAYSGRTYGERDVGEALARLGAGYVVRRLADPVESTAHALANGEVIGWCRGRSEFGPRALGNRSILCGAANPWTKDVVNGFVKNREWFRPFAPAIPAERAEEYFEMRGATSPDMMKTVAAQSVRAGEIPSAVHVDGSARVQTVAQAANPDFHRLITRFADLTGTPVLLNTSFNEGGKPLLDSPSDAVEAFVNFGLGMDALVWENHEIRRA